MVLRFQSEPPEDQSEPLEGQFAIKVNRYVDTIRTLNDFTKTARFLSVVLLRNVHAEQPLSFKVRKKHTPEQKA